MKRTRLITILTAAAVPCFLTIAICRNREPRYQGRTLAEWIAESRRVEGDVRFLATNSEWQAVSYNVKQMAPEAIPWLLKWVQVKDSGLKWKIGNWLNLHPLLHLHVKSEWEFKRDAMDGFRLLGPEARPAWPTLAKMAQGSKDELRLDAMECFFESRPPKEVFVPVLLLASLHDPDRGIRFSAAHMFHYRFPQEAEAAGIYKMFPGLKNQPTEQNPTKALVN